MSNVVTSTDDGSGFPNWVGATYDRQNILRYGENPHQRAAVYTAGYGDTAIAGAQQLLQTTKIEKLLKIDNIYAPENFRFTRYMEAALKAHIIFHRDRDYVVRDGDVMHFRFNV